MDRKSTSMKGFAFVSESTYLEGKVVSGSSLSCPQGRRVVQACVYGCSLREHVAAYLSRLYSGLYFCILERTNTLTQILFSFGLGSPIGHCIPHRSFYAASHAIDDIKRFNPIPGLPTYSHLIKNYATFTACSCDLLHVCAVDQKIRPKIIFRASRENNLTIGPGKTMGVEPLWKA